jgi:hypothetical protein
MTFYGHLRNLYLERLLILLRKGFASPSLIDAVRHEYRDLDASADLPKLANALLRQERNIDHER